MTIEGTKRRLQNKSRSAEQNYEWRGKSKLGHGTKK
jgi:hypothetical protein